MNQASTLSLDFAAVTDIGCRRTNNEDSFGYDAERQIYVVCDGMGGNAAGEVASSMAVRALIECFEAMAMSETESVNRMPVESRLLSSILEANRVVREAGSDDPELRTMGTTLVCACLDGDRIVIGNVGDSRAYLLRSGACRQITQDHSLIDEQIRNGNMTPEMAATSKLQSVITRAIGAADTVEPDLFAAKLQPDDMLLLVSDGLTRYAQPEDIALAASHESDLTTICNRLIEHAKQRGGADNITCILMRVVDTPTTPADESESSSPTI
jgi:serine/threonine protein phosphatase PrpC